MEDKEKIKEYHKEYEQASYEPSIFGNVGAIARAKDTTTQKTSAYALYEYVINNPTVTEICVIDEQEKVVGIYTRTALMESFGGRFGFDLNSKKTAQDLMKTNFLVADENVSIEAVSKMALVRATDSLYDAVVVTKKGKYMGVVSVKDLLETAITIQVSRAVDANPLTGLPGNRLIERKISECIQNEDPFAVIYIDLDNFKAYNDAYGFNNGDLMIKAVVHAMRQCCSKNEFMGHVGGDDFVVICDYWEVEMLCNDIINKFCCSIKSLYVKSDWDNGYIISKNRSGLTESFPIATLSIAGITNKDKAYENMELFSKELANLKKKAKQVIGNYFCIQ